MVPALPVHNVVAVRELAGTSPIGRDTRGRSGRDGYRIESGTSGSVLCPKLKSITAQAGLLPQVDSGAALPMHNVVAVVSWRIYNPFIQGAASMTVMENGGAWAPPFCSGPEVGCLRLSVAGRPGPARPVYVLGVSLLEVPELGRDDGVILHIDEGASQVGGGARALSLVHQAEEIPAGCSSRCRSHENRSAGQPLPDSGRFVLLARLLGAEAVWLVVGAGATVAPARMAPSRWTPWWNGQLGR